MFIYFSTFNRNGKMDILIYDFEKNWKAVSHHIDTPRFTEMLDKALLRVSLEIISWNEDIISSNEMIPAKVLPLWDRENGLGPWEFSIYNYHEQDIITKVNKDPELRDLNQKYKKLCDNIKVKFDDIINDNETDFVSGKLREKYKKELDVIKAKYHPPRNSYKWYQCFGADYHMSDWHLELAQIVKPSYEWKTAHISNEEEDKSDYFTTVGKSKDHKYTFFDILLFDRVSPENILDELGLLPENLTENFPDSQ